ncbi:calmodulin-binding protein [Kitasatospora sp. NBC_01250]|uniref:BP74-related protein n=1 Tax=Kitasatospora sp. NBC_01250 TaxID=2903571 RepID=UPI002E2F737F|nr:calmodulin-binding protein [Kitasatospora sp. NBC_01250]
MRRILTKFSGLAAISMLALAVAQPAQAAQASAAPAYFEFTDSTQQTFVFKLTDQGKIQQARNILAGTETERTQVIGKVVKTPAPYNKPWKYQLDPDSVSFFGMAVEACDSNMVYLGQHLNEVGGAFLPGSTWCDWGSKLTREVTPQ